ncbi:unnamed protein product [Leptidea sinapis]|uniref:Uncharacterized protein n=1 Tax=Leptidea sinapis TaxID=189913 RepID=A0A5E4QSQ4_9NEOP|nr:unnamed protein product [Leptidea sinapis]
MAEEKAVPVGDVGAGRGGGGANAVGRQPLVGAAHVATDLQKPRRLRHRLSLSILCSPPVVRQPGPGSLHTGQQRAHGTMQRAQAAHALAQLAQCGAGTRHWQYISGLLLLRSPKAAIHKEKQQQSVQYACAHISETKRWHTGGIMA